MPYQDELSYLYSLQRFGIKLGLSNIKDLCSLLDNPQEKIRTVHIGGTNGKGSTAAVLSAVLQESGYKVGLYTSPHLIDFTERIRINNIQITPEEVSRLVGYIRDRIKDTELTPTFFEFTTALALLYFAKEGVDIAIMEVGMGGRMDATNIINPLVSVITNVDYDHTEHLGRSLEEITREKCGIIKEKVPVVTSEIKKDVLFSIGQKVREVGTSVYMYHKDFYAEPLKITCKDSHFYYNGLIWKRLFLESSLAGRHQMYNIGAALCTIELLTENGFKVTELQVIEGVRNVSWPGRLETFPSNPLVLLDGAHNYAGTVALREFIEEVVKRNWMGGKVVLIFGVLKDKDVHSMAGELIPFSSEVIITKPNTERGLPVEVFSKIVERYGIKPHATQTVSEALSHAYDIASPSDIIVITGSLYVVGEARALITGKRVNV